MTPKHIKQLRQKTKLMRPARVVGRGVAWAMTRNQRKAVRGRKSVVGK